MTYLLFLTLLVAGTYGARLPAVPSLDGRIVGGTSASIQEAPYQVAALLDYWGSGTYKQACGGSIISNTVIVTAAHCTDRTIAARWRIRAGSTFHNSGGVVIQVKTIVQHSSFNSRLDYDISLLKLSAAFTFGDSIAKVALPVQGAAVIDGSLGFVTGWGTSSEGGVAPTSLFKATVPVIGQQLCFNAYAAFNTVTDRMLCAGYLGIGGIDACQGDSGGPLTLNKVLIGITSWGRGCAQPEYPGVYTRVPEFVNWINVNM